MNILETLQDLGGLLEGHFVLKSGRHSGQYLNKDVIYPDPVIMRRIGDALTDLAENSGIRDVDLVAGPVMGGVILAQWTAYSFCVGSNHPLAIYAEKVPPNTGSGFCFNRGYAEMIPGRRVLLVEDIITTGGSIVSVSHAVSILGGKVVGIVALVNRGGVEIENLHTLASLDVESWDAADCPLCKRGIPINTDVGHGKK